MKSKIPFVFAFALTVLGSANAGHETQSDGNQLNVDAYVLSSINPVYPVEMQRIGESGKALVKVIVSENGELAEAKIISASRDEFGAAALDAVRNWEFEAAKKNGKSVAQVVVVPVRFQFGEAVERPVEIVASL